jgi:hypothetical protein
VPAWARGLVAVTAVGALVLLVDFFYWRQSAELSIQSEQNLRFGHVDAIVPRPELKAYVARLLRLFSRNGD